MQNFFWNKITKAGLMAAIAISCSSLAMAEENNEGRVLMQSPAANGAYIIKMPGFVNNQKVKLMDGQRKTIDDGVVIRQSQVKDGKVIIPASGLYTTSRCSNWHPFNNHAFTIAGKPYYFITDEYQQDVVKNVTMKPGQMIFGDDAKTRGWRLKSIDAKPFGIQGGHMAYFDLVKATGNNYGNPFIIVAGENITPTATDGSYQKNGSGLKEGTTSYKEQKDIRPYLVGNNVSTNSRSNIIIDSLSPTEAKIRELVTISTPRALISATPPVIGQYAKGDAFKLGNAEVTIMNISPDSATIQISENGQNVVKELKASQEDLKLFPASRVVCDAMYMQSPDGKKLVNLNPRAEGGPFANGKVALMGYDKVIDVRRGAQWEADKRFITRPETCAECTYTHEIVLENDQPIVLDAQNNKFVGPEGYFTIVIDEMNPDNTIKAWHIENAKGKSDNLAGRAQGKNLDMVLGAACRSTGHFFNRVYPQLYKEAMGVK